jgi:hypothetical protein
VRKGTFHSLASKEKIVKSHLGKTPWNKGLTKETSESIRKNGISGSKTKKKRFLLGEIVVWNKGLTKSSNSTLAKIGRINSIKRKGSKQTKESNRKRRIGMISHIEKTKGKPYCNIGNSEKQLLDLQEQKDHCKIQRQFHIKELGYFVDGYCPETNTVYEVYEKYHDNQVFKDLDRETEICNHLSCDFIIIWERFE